MPREIKRKQLKEEEIKKPIEVVIFEEMTRALSRIIYEDGLDEEVPEKPKDPIQ